LNKYKLSDEEKQQVIREFKKDPDLKRITQVVSGDPEADGRHKIGRAIRAFLSEQNKEYKTTKHEECNAVNLTEQQRDFLMGDHIDSDMTPLDIARIVFENGEIKSLSLHHRAVINFLTQYRPDIINENEVVTSERWNPPTAVSRSVKKVNDWAGQEISIESISNKHEKMMRMLIKYLHSPRLKQTINEYCRVTDRELFESEFVRATWDKPDLTSDEQNQYITLCTNYVRIKHIQARLDKLNKMLDDMGDDAQGATIRFTELIKTTSEELNQCEKRVEALTKSLNGSRQDRLKAKGERSGSIEALVEAFQDKQDRDLMIKMAEMKKRLVADTADKLETMNEFKARVLGISKEELL
jgi:hypothetical protein